MKEIKKSAKKIVKKLPYIKNYVNKYELLRIQLEDEKAKTLFYANKAIDKGLQLKMINAEKINVVFVCHRPAVWETLHSVYDAIKMDERFNVYIVAIPNKNELPGVAFNHEIYESEGAEEFWKKYDCINGYNYDSKEWFDLKTLNPDFVFFQQPYNIMKPEPYKSYNVALYAKICYLNYFSPVNFGEVYDECTPLDFLRDISFYFTQNELDHKYICNRYSQIKNSITNIIMTGYPRYDKLCNYKNSRCDIWNYDNRPRIIWTPRWTTNEGNCHFFDYKDKLFDFCIKNEVEFVFRPHPQAFAEWNATGEFTSKQKEELFIQYEKYDNMHIDESSSYLDKFYSSDILISDVSSIMYDYLLTGNPIIYCTSSGVNDEATLLKDGMYLANDWETVEKLLLKIINKEDELKTKRQEVIKSAYYFNKKGAGNEIKDILINYSKGKGRR